MQRNSNIERLKNEKFDIVIIGSGASGAGVALDAVLRGFKVALIDKGDFAGETSSRSTKLIHGGVRYLEQAFKQLDMGHLKQVKHGLAERRFLLNNAPHLSRPLGIITPVFSLLEAIYFSIGLRMYGWFAKGDTMPKSTWLSKKDTLAFSPQINNKIHSSVMYYDGQLDDARYTLALTQSANNKGAVVVNYLSVNSFEKNNEGKLSKAILKNEINGESFIVESKLFINCTGPFADDIRLMANPSETPRIKPAKGVHIVLDKSFFNSEKAMLIPKTKDGRLVFVIPFKTEVIVGTTDTPYKDIHIEPVLEDKEASFLLETVADFLEKKPIKSDIKSGFGGVRPLLSPKRNSTKETKGLLRDHEVEVDNDSGLISLLGGKWTTYRLMAEDTVDVICDILQNNEKSSTQNFKLWGAEEFKTESRLPYFKNIGPVSLGHLHENYGNKVIEILNIAKERDEFQEKIHISFPFIKAEIAYACRYEMTLKPRDFLARRVRLEFLDWRATKDALDVVCDIMALELGWSENQKQIEKSIYFKLISNFESNINIK